MVKQGRQPCRACPQTPDRIFSKTVIEADMSIAADCVALPNDDGFTAGRETSRFTAR
jgi:hypothetical protein